MAVALGDWGVLVFRQDLRSSGANSVLQFLIERGAVGRPHGGAGHWDSVARGQSRTSPRDGLVDEHGRATHAAMVARWSDPGTCSRILKTDLFDVAFASHPFLFDLDQVGDGIVGLDISSKVVDAARRRARDCEIGAGGYLCGDVRCIPLRENSIDLVISDSTLDHFASEADIVAALRELRRVLRHGGTLILTMDNKKNVTYPPYPIIRLWMRLGLAPYFIGKTLSPSGLRRTLEGIGFSVDESTAIFHCPHPDALVRRLETWLRRVSRGRLDGAIRGSLVALERLGSRRTRYLTGRYIAVKAVKLESGRQHGASS